MLVLLGDHLILHISRIRVKLVVRVVTTGLYRDKYVLVRAIYV